MNYLYQAVMDITDGGDKEDYSYVYRSIPKSQGTSIKVGARILRTHNIRTPLSVNEPLRFCVTCLYVFEVDDYVHEIQMHRKSQWNSNTWFDAFWMCQDCGECWLTDKINLISVDDIVVVGANSSRTTYPYNQDYSKLSKQEISDCILCEGPLLARKPYFKSKWLRLDEVSLIRINHHKFLRHLEPKGCEDARSN